MALDRTEATERLRSILDDNPTVYCILRHRSASGMTRWIDLYAIQDNEPVWIGYTAATVLDMTWSDKHTGIRVAGAGMDMGFHIVNNLSQRLYCPDAYDHDAAYRLKHRWI